MQLDKYTALIVDDEPVARDVIQVLLKDYSIINVVGFASDGKEALTEIKSLKPDILFIDIHMPLLNGLNVVEKIEKDNLPHVVFTTAYDEHAIKAFDLNAVDYLLKPFDKHRFKKTMEKVLRAMKYKELSDFESKLKSFANDYSNLKEETHHASRVPAYATKITARDSKKIVFIDVDSISVVNASGDYIEICYNGQKQLLYKSLNEIEARLDPAFFHRIHRSHIIHSKKIKEIRPHQNGEYHFHMDDGHVIKSSRSYKDTVISIIDA